MAVDLIRAKESDAQEVVGFHNAYYGDRRTVAEWRWQFYDYLPQATVVTKLAADGVIAGTQAMMPVHLRFGADTILSGKSESTLLRANLRGGGRMKALYEFAAVECRKNGMACLWGFSDQAKAFLGFGFQVVPCASTWRRPAAHPISGIVGRLRERRSLLRRFVAAGRFARDYAKVMPTLATRVDPIVNGIEVVEVEATFLNSYWPVYLKDLAQRITIDRNAQFAVWRWQKNPRNKYRYVAVYRNGNPIGLATFTASGGNGYLADFLSSEAVAAKAIVNWMIERWDTKVGFLFALANDRGVYSKDLVNALFAAGFRKVSTTNFVLRILDPNLSGEFSDIRNWDFSEAWSDGFAS